jgi:hypothetical protein
MELAIEELSAAIRTLPADYALKPNFSAALYFFVSKINNQISNKLN